jgi:hypothetical protein
VTRKRMVLLVLLIALIGIQFVPINKKNPPALADAEAPMEVKTILVRSCYDCHSNETRWPWYSKIAPVSWLVANDVKEGRKHLNFSDWEKLYTDKQRKLADDIVDEIDGDNMPPSLYTILHPGANLDMEKKQLIKKWIKEKVH